MPTATATKITVSSNSAKKKQRLAICKEAILSRWESVRAERQMWMKPFTDLSIERALAYLEDLRKICEDAGHILTQRIGADKDKMRCVNCRKDVSGTNTQGRPTYMGKFDLRDKNDPSIIRSVYVCSMLCQNAWARKSQGALGTTGH